MNYRKLNIYLGWTVFLIATIVYFLTIEDTVSLWDCGEYITAAYKLEVGHPPGAPLFMVIGRLFSFFADPENVAVWINRMSALSSSLTILFMFWSITALVKKMILKSRDELSKGDMIAIMGSGAIGALAYTFSDTFWFSAVEGEVYAMASLFTAVIFWAILKWDEEMALLEGGKLSVEVAPNRWLLIIMFLLGLAIGVHLLGILLVPAIGYVIYFRLWKDVTPGKFMITGIVSVFVLGFIQEGIIPGTISIASSFEVAFTNSMGLPFFSGTIFFFLLLIGGLVIGLRYARKKGHTILYNSFMGLIVLLIGYGSFAVIVIRSNANTPLDENDPENLVTLHSYLKREQYGSAPLLSGPFWNSMESGGRFEDGRWNGTADRSEWKSRSPFYLRRYVVLRNGSEVKAFKDEAHAKAYAAENGLEYEDRYFESNASYRENVTATYQQNTLFPRMYYADDARKIQGYKDWSGYDAAALGDYEKGKDGLRLPTFGENMTYFFRYQVNWMYWRYFMWNFAGRQNDYQGHEGSAMRGNWISGISAIDNARLGNQEMAPYYTVTNPANNKFYFLPLILGFIGLLFHFYKAPKDAFVVFLSFLFTGLAIVVYLNQKTYEPRERDYAYAGSFYFFALWIGVGVYALYEFYRNFDKNMIKKIGIVVGAGLLLFLVSDASSPVGMPLTMSWIVMSVIAIIMIGIMVLAKKGLKGETQGAVLATLIGLVVPIIMGMQGWDDHDRSNKTSAHDLAYDYLISCADNGIIFTNGDNDTFPLWYMQEVEGFKTSVRVCNLSLMQTDWYTDQMKMKAYDSEPLPIKFREDQILMYAGNTDQVYFTTLTDSYLNPSIPKSFSEKLLNLRAETNPDAMLASVAAFANKMGGVLATVNASNPAHQQRIELLKEQLTKVPTTLEEAKENVPQKFEALLELFQAYSGGVLTMDQNTAQAIQRSLPELEKGWDAIDLTKAMEFVRDDANLVDLGGGVARFFPSSKFTLKVNKENAVNSGIITADQKKDCRESITFEYTTPRLTREEVMMLDILANNNWERGIYFSSPYGSEFSMALMKSGLIKQLGTAYLLSPLKSMNLVEPDVMYKNLMEVYHYGDIANPDVLTDYYARRHTEQYRLQFITLQQYYVNQLITAKNAKQNGPSYVTYLRSSGQNDRADEVEYILNNYDKVTKTAKERVKKLAQKCLEVMPLALVYDNGEPKGSREKLKAQGVELPVYSDGQMVESISYLFEVGEKEFANEVGLELAKQYKSVIEYFLVSDDHFILDGSNQTDLFASITSYFNIAVSASEFDQSGVLAKETMAYMQELYGKRLPDMYSAMETKIKESGESLRRGNSNPMANRYYQLRDYLDAVGMHYGILKGDTEVIDSGQDLDIEELIRQSQGADTVNG